MKMAVDPADTCRGFKPVHVAADFLKPASFKHVNNQRLQISLTKIPLNTPELIVSVQAKAPQAEWITNN